MCLFYKKISIYVVEINDCASSPCRNGATCDDAVNSYTCLCVAGYTETHCESGKDEDAAVIAYVMKLQRGLLVYNMEFYLSN